MAFCGYILLIILIVTVYLAKRCVIESNCKIINLSTSVHDLSIGPLDVDLGTRGEAASAWEDGWYGQGRHTGQWQCAWCRRFIIGRWFSFTGLKEIVCTVQIVYGISLIDYIFFMTVTVILEAKVTKITVDCLWSDDLPLVLATYTCNRRDVASGISFWLVMFISNFSKIRISKVRIRSKSGYRISSELHDKCQRYGRVAGHSCCSRAAYCVNCLLEQPDWLLLLSQARRISLFDSGRVEGQTLGWSVRWQGR